MPASVPRALRHAQAGQAFSRGHRAPGVDIAAEALVAATGIFPEKITQTLVEEAISLPRVWQRRIRAWFGSDANERFTLYPRPDHEETLEKLTAGMQPAAAASLVRGLPPDQAQAYLAQLSNAREHVRAIWPALRLETPTGPELLPPSTMEMGRAWSVLAVIDHPTRLLDEMAMGTITAEQADAVAEVYPALFDVLRGLIDEEINRRRMERKTYKVPYRHQQILRTLLGLPPGVQLTQIAQEPARKIAKSAPASNPIQIDFTTRLGTKAQQLEQA